VPRDDLWLSRLRAKTPKWAWAVAGVAALVVVSVIFLLTDNSSSSSTAAADQDSQYSQHPEDIKVTSCVESGGYATAKLRATNSSTDQSTYALKISFQSPDGQSIYSTQEVVIPQLDPHTTSAVQAVRSSSAVGSKPVACVVAAAARYGS
jgi:hypothetical protein